MAKYKKILSILMTLALVLFLGSPANAKWSPEKVEGTGLYFGTSNFGFTSSVVTCSTSGALCEPCPTPTSSIGCGVDVNFDMVFPKCEKASEMNCIETLSVGPKGGKLVEATYQGAYGRPQVSGFEQLGISRPGTVLTYQTAAADGLSKVDYAVAAHISGFIKPGLGLQYRYLTVAVTPFTRTTRDPADPFRCHFQPAGGPFTDCLEKEDFPEDTAIALKLHVSNQIGQWYWGRMADPTVEINTVGPSLTTFTVQGVASSVPVVQVDLSKVPASGEQSTWLRKNWVQENALNYVAPENALEALDLFQDAHKDKSSGSASVWEFNSSNNWFVNSSGCFTSKAFQGFVVSNATGYSHQPPYLSEGKLRYQVGSTHFAEDGKTLNRGSYSLVLSKSTAKCLYGISGSSAVSASISVLSEGGETQIATTSFSEKNDTYRFSANNFTYSSPTIAVKLTQVTKPRTPTTITCVKKTNRKVTKRITAVSPRCPSGYIKK